MSEPAPAGEVWLDALGVRVGLSGEQRLLELFRAGCADLLAGDGVPVTTQVQLRLPPGDTFADALARFTEIVVSASDLLCVHAGVTLGPAGVLVTPGHSGLGKSTLTAALVRAGFSYLSDEALAVDRDTGRVARFPRPLGLAPDVWQLLGLTATAERGERERHFAPTDFGTVAQARTWPTHAPEVGDIVLVERRDGPAGLRRIGDGPAVHALLRRSFNHYRRPDSSFRTAVQLALRSRVWAASYAEAPELAALLATELR